MADIITPVIPANPSWNINFFKSSAQDFIDNNTVLQANQIGIESDTRRFKVGDGSSGWNSLNYGVLGEVPSVGLKLSPASDNLLTVSGTDGGLKLSEAAFNFLSIAQAGWTGAIQNLNGLTGEPQQQASAFIGLMLRQVVTLGLGDAYLGILDQSTTPATVTSRLAVVEAALATVAGAVSSLVNNGAPATDKVYSSDYIQTRIDQRFSDFVGDAPGTLNTIYELSTALGNNPNFVTNLVTQLGNCVKYVAQSLSAPQQAQALANIDALSTAGIGTLADAPTWNEVLNSTTVASGVSIVPFLGTDFAVTPNFKNYAKALVGPVKALDGTRPGAKIPLVNNNQFFLIPCGAETKAVTTGMVGGTFSASYPTDITFVRASVSTPSTSAITLSVKVNGVEKCTPTFLANALTSVGSAAAGNTVGFRLQAGDVVSVSVTLGDGAATGLKVYLLGRPAVQTTEELQIANIFNNGTQGAWYTYNDFTLLDQATGSTPVTALEQSLGVVRDRSGWGYHAVQATAGNRPKLSARVNLLGSTELIDGWASTAAGSVTVPGYFGSFNGIKLLTDPALPDAPNKMVSINNSLPASKIVTAGCIVDFDTLNSTECQVTLLSVPVGGGTQYLRATFPRSDPTAHTGSGFPGGAPNGIRSKRLYANVWELSIVGRFGVASSTWGLSVSGGTATNLVIGKPFVALGSVLPPAYQAVAADDSYTVGDSYPPYVDFTGSKTLTTTFPSGSGSNWTVCNAILGVGGSISSGQTVTGSLTLTQNAVATLIFNRALTTDETALISTYLNYKALPA